MSELALKRTGGQARRFCNYGTPARMYNPEDNYWPSMHQSGDLTFPLESKSSGSILFRSNYGTGSSYIRYYRVYTASIAIFPRITNVANIDPTKGYWHPSFAVWLDNHEAEFKTLKIPAIEILYKSEKVGTLEMTFRIVDPGEALVANENYGGIQIDWKFNKTTSKSLTSSLVMTSYVDDISERVDIRT